MTLTYLTSYTKLNSEHGTDYKTIKFVIESIKENLGRSQVFFKRSTKYTKYERKIDKFEFINIKIFCSSKDMIEKIKSKSHTSRKYLQNIYVI